MEFKSFVIGYVTCIVFNLIFSITSYFLEKAFTYRQLRNAEITEIDVKEDE